MQRQGTKSCIHRGGIRASGPLRGALLCRPYIQCGAPSPAMLGRPHGTRSVLMLLTRNPRWCRRCAQDFAPTNSTGGPCLFEPAQRASSRAPAKSEHSRVLARSANRHLRGRVFCLLFLSLGLKRYKKSESPQPGPKPKVEKCGANEQCATPSAPHRRSRESGNLSIRVLPTMDPGFRRDDESAAGSIQRGCHGLEPQ